MDSSRRSVLGFVGLLLSSLAPSVASATPVAGRVRVGVEGALLSHRGYSVSGDSMPSTSASETSLGPSAAPFGVGVGTSLTESVWLDGRLLLGTSDRSVDSGPSATTRMVAIHAVPAYVFDGDAFHPYVGVDLGYEHEKTTASGAADASASLGTIGAVLGARCFVTDSFSVDPALTASWEKGTESLGDVSLDRSGFGLTLGVALSGWVGDAHPSAPAAAEPPATTGTADATARPEVRAPDVPLPEQTRSSSIDASVELDADTRVSFATDLHGPGEIAVELTAKFDPAEAIACGPLRASVDGETIALRGGSAKRRFTGVGFVVVVKTGLVLEDAARLARGDAVAFERCGRRWAIPAGALAPLLRMTETARYYASARTE